MNFWITSCGMTSSHLVKMKTKIRIKKANNRSLLICMIEMKLMDKVKCKQKKKIKIKNMPSKMENSRRNLKSRIIRMINKQMRKINNKILKFKKDSKFLWIGWKKYLRKRVMLKIIN